jgi:hypothetical protein
MSSHPLKPDISGRGGPKPPVVFLGVNRDTEQGGQKEQEDQGFKGDFNGSFFFPEAEKSKEEGAIDQDFKKEKIRVMGSPQEKRDGQDQEVDPINRMEARQKKKEEQPEGGCYFFRHTEN